MSSYHVSNGIVSTGINLGYGDSMFISSGGTANNTTNNYGGYITIFSGGTANNTIIKSSGYITISSGATANDTTVNVWGYMYISSGATANDTIINSRGYMVISSGGTANSTTVNSDGYMYIHSNGTANNTVINLWGSMVISSGGTANNTTVNAGDIWISPDGTANSTTINSGGGMNIFSGATANSTTINNGGMDIISGGTANNTVVNSSGSMSIDYGATANNTTINDGGHMVISSGATATNLEVMSGGTLEIMIAPDTYVQGTSNGSAFEMKDGFIEGYTINYEGWLVISSGGTANSTTINSGYMDISSGATANNTTVNDGNMNIDSGATANNTTVNKWGYVRIFSDGTANNTVVNSRGSMCIEYGATANSTTVNDGGSMYIDAGGTALSIKENGGFIDIADGANVTFVSNTINDFTLCSAMTVHSNTVANNTTVDAGDMYIYAGGTANNTIVNDGGSMCIYAGGTANSTTLINNGRLIISSGGTANDTIVKSRSHLFISSGATANNTIINSSGYVWIDSGGTANSTTVNYGGWMVISSGATASNTTVKNNGCMVISSRSKHYGVLQIESGAYVDADSGAIIDFTVADQTKTDDYLINNLALIKGAPTYTITVSADQEAGTYKLAQGASTFTDSISICTQDTCFGSLTVNGAALAYESKTYSLVQSSGNLRLVISDGSSAGGSQVKIYSSGSLVKQGTEFTGETIGYGGDIHISSGGTANNTTVNDGDMYIYAGGAANDTTLDGDMTISSGGTANNTVINHWGSMVISSGGTANSTTINSGGHMDISSGATANSTTINSSGLMFIESGATANSTTINSRGYMYISSGGTATDIEVMSGGELEITVALDTYVQGTSNGSAFEMKDGFIEGYTINKSGHLDIYSGGTANNTTVNKWGGMTISSGGTANNTIANGGVIGVDDGGTINDTTINSGTYMVIHNGGSANDTTVNDGGYLDIFSNATANNTTVNSNGSMLISSGATALLIKENGGYVNVENGAHVTFAENTINGLILNSSMTVHSNTVANNTTVKSWGDMVIYSGGIANSTILNKGSMIIEYGGTINDTTIKSGYIYISSGATANNTTVNSNGSMLISSDGKHCGTLQIESGAAVSAYSGAIIDFTVADRTKTDDYLINNLALIQGAPTYTITVSAVQETGSYKLAQGASNFTGTITICTQDTCFGSLSINGAALTYESKTYSLVQSSGNLQLVISDGSSAGGSQVKIYSSGSLVKQGTEFTGETIVSGGNNSMFVSSGGTANSTTVNYFGSMYISGGTANSTIINARGSINICSAGTANSTTINSGGSADVSSDGTANSTTLNAGGYFTIWKGGTASDTVINNNGYMSLEGGIADNTIIKSMGILAVKSGGTANHTTLHSAWVHIGSGGTANNTTIDSMGYVYVSSGGTANSTTINSAGSMRIFSGGTATNITTMSGGTLLFTVASDTYVQGISNGSTFEMKDAFISGYTITRGSMGVSSGGTANNTVVNSLGYMDVYSGGTVNSTTLNTNGIMNIWNSGTADNTIINSRGYMAINSGGKHCSSLQLGAGAYVHVYDGGMIDFSVAGRTSANDYLINNLSLIYGAPTYTITVSADQEAGTYKLAQGATKFTGTMTICTQDTCFGSLTVNGKALTYNDVTYQLNKNDGALTLTVSNGSVVIENEPVFTFGKFNGVGGMFELTVDGVGYVHNVYMKVQLAGTLDLSKWELVGVADFNKSGTDGLLWLEKDTGYVYMQNNLTSFDEVNNKQYCLGVIGEGYEILAAGDFTGTGIHGVLMQGPAFGDASVSLNYGLPIWGRETDGTTFNGWLGALVNTWQPGDALKGDTSDLADINAQNYMYEVVSVGDYNGDGVDDVMLQNIMPKTVDGVTITGSGDVFTFLTGDINAVKAGAAPTVAYAGCATDGWEVMGSGDFNGDGIDDVLLSDGTGVAGWQMANGQRAENFWFGNLGATEEIAGIADLNNDGTDDIVVLNAATETYHGWMISKGAISHAVTLA